MDDLMTIIFWKMRFKTYPISFGKDYRYRVRMIAKFGGDGSNQLNRISDLTYPVSQSKHVRIKFYETVLTLNLVL